MESNLVDGKWLQLMEDDDLRSGVYVFERLCWVEGSEWGSGGSYTLGLVTDCS